jgi:hypothetical protein
MNTPLKLNAQVLAQSGYQVAAAQAVFPPRVGKDGEAGSPFEVLFACPRAQAEQLDVTYTPPGAKH